MPITYKTQMCVVDFFYILGGCRGSVIPFKEFISQTLINEVENKLSSTSQDLFSV